MPSRYACVFKRHPISKLIMFGGRADPCQPFLLEFSPPCSLLLSSCSQCLHDPQHSYIHAEAYTHYLPPLLRTAEILDQILRPMAIFCSLFPGLRIFLLAWLTEGLVIYLRFSYWTEYSNIIINLDYSVSHIFPCVSSWETLPLWLSLMIHSHSNLV